MKNIYLIYTISLFLLSSAISAQVVVQLGTGTATSTSNAFALISTTTNNYSKNFIIYDAAEIIANGGFAGIISKLAWNKQGTGEYITNDGILNIYLKHVNYTQHNTSTELWSNIINGATLVYSSNNFSWPTGTGWKELILQNTFTWNGTDHLAVMVDWHKATQVSSAISWQISTVTNANKWRLTGAPITDLSQVNSNRVNMQATFIAGSKDLESEGMLIPAQQVCQGGNFQGEVKIKNNGMAPYDFLQDPATVDLQVTGATSLNLSYTINNNSLNNNNPLAAGASMVVPVGIISLPMSGNYEFTASVTSAADNNSSNDTSAVQFYVVNPLPSVIASANPPEVCLGSNVTISATGALIYNIDQGVFGSPFSPLNTQSYTITGTDTDGCSNSHTITIPVNPLPIVVANASASEICSGDPLVLFGTGALYYSWSHFVVDGISFTPVMTFTYTVTGTDANNCSNTDEITVTVNELPNVTATASEDSVCEGGFVTLTGSGANNYTWDHNVLNGVPFVPQNTEFYTVTGIDDNGCMNTFVVTVWVNPLPTVDLLPFDSICENTPPFALTGGSPINGTYFSSTGISNDLFNPATGAGTYIIQYIYTDSLGCSNSSTQPLIVKNCTGIGTIISNAYDLKLFPNPAQGQFFIMVNLPSNYSAIVQLIDSKGSLVQSLNKELSAGENIISMDTGTYTPGVYSVKVLTEMGAISKKLLIK